MVSCLVMLAQCGWAEWSTRVILVENPLSGSVSNRFNNGSWFRFSSGSKYCSGLGLVRFTWAPFSRFRFGSVHSRKILLVQVRFGFIDLKFTVITRFVQKKKRRNCWSCWSSPLLLLCVYQRQRASGYRKKYILTFVGVQGSVRVHLSTILRVQVWFGFIEVKFAGSRFGLGSPKWNGSFGFTVRFDTLLSGDLVVKLWSK